MKARTLALVGNPNCGKTTLFNALTGAHQRVGNWPGITVERKLGHFSVDGQPYDLVDLPGTYAIDSQSAGVSEDERIARDYAVSGEADLLINVVDASNLQRNLYLTLQLLELGRPMLVVLNLIDVVHDRGEQLDLAALESALDCPVIAVSASSGTGLSALRQAIARAAARVPRPAATLGATLEQWLEQQQARQPGRTRQQWVADLECGRLPADQWPELHGEDVDIVVASSRYEQIDNLCRQVITRPGSASISTTERLDRIVLSRVFGIPIFLLSMYLMFLLAINLGAVFIDFFDGLTGTLLVDGTAHLLGLAGAPEWLTAILAHGVGGGIQTVSTFIPVVMAMFLCLAFLEDSGYLARAAMVIDRAMRAIGLPGKAFVPMLVGFGCNVPAIMGTRTLDSTRDRLTAIMMVPFMSCGARLPVYALFAAVFFPSNGQNVVFGLYLLGIAMAILTGLAMKRTLLPGEATPFVMELPPYRLPNLRGVLTHTWMRLRSFVVNAGRVIVCVVVVLSLFNSLGTDGSFGNENSDKSVLSAVGRTITPVFTPMGIQPDNWPATVGLFTGIFAKEAVVGTLDALYSQLARHAGGEHADAKDAGYDPVAGIEAAFATIPANLAGLSDAVLDPLGLKVASEDQGTLAEDKNLHESTFGQMAQLFGGASAGLAYLVFVLLYTPCVAAMGAVWREAGPRWAVIVAGWTFALAWGTATLTYQTSRLATHPGEAGGWMAAVLVCAALALLVLRQIGQRGMAPELATAEGCGGSGCGKCSC